MNSQACDHHSSTDHFKQPRHWSRLVYMLLFGLLLNLAGAVMWLLAALQFGFVLTTGKDNDRLREFGGSVAIFVEQALMFVSYNSEYKPFPFAQWPSRAEADDHPAGADEAQAQGDDDVQSPPPPPQAQ